ncbi:Rac GTPase-activating protein 1-like protein [Aix galericulata]|nr:Rac GTPase-activating protein 1-like protein [Aix galericulata]
MLRQRCGRLLAQLERALQLLELGGSLEEDYIRIARCFEATRQKCRRLEQDGRRAREQLARAEAERAALEVKLKHARNQVEVEMKKRHRAEAELEKQERKLQLVFESLMQEPWGNGEQCSVLRALAGRRLGVTLAPGRRCWLGSGGAPAALSPSSSHRSSAVDDSCQSLLSHSDISYDRTEDDVDVEVTVARALKRKAQERQRVSLAPQIGPVVVAKRHRSSVAPPSSVTVPPAPPPAEVPEPAGSLPPAVLVPPRRSRQGHRVSARAEPAAAWGTSEDSGGRAPGQDSHTEGGSGGQPAPAPFTSPPPSLLQPQHQFTSKTGVLADFAPPTPPLVPALVVHCVTEVETRGLAEAGLYRVPGAEPLVREWKQRLLRAGGALPSLGDVSDIHVVCGVLKDFLRGLKEPLVTFSLHPAFLRAADIPDETACSTALRHVVGKLPPANRDTLAFLMLHLLRVSRSPDCKMDILNLSRVFGPTLVGHSSATPTPLAIMEDTPRQSKVVARLLALPPDFWRGFVGTEQENLVPTPASAPDPGGECEPLCHPVASSEPHGGQLSPPGTCCLPGALRSCVGTAARPPKVGRFFPSPV